MNHRWAFFFLLSFGTVLSFVGPIPARADFLIRFTDSREVLVHRYAEEGQAIKIYTPYGTISFRKEEVERITEVDASQSMSTPLESALPVATSSTQRSSLAPAESEKAKDLDKTIKTERGKMAEASNTSSAASERIDGQYREIEQEFNRVWEKHVQDINAGAAEEVIAENREKLDQLSNERHNLIEEAHRVAPENLPTWAQ